MASGVSSVEVFPIIIIVLKRFRLLLASQTCYNLRAFGVWRSLVAHLYGVQVVARSNRATPTTRARLATVLGGLLSLTGRWRLLVTGQASSHSERVIPASCKTRASKLRLTSPACGLGIGTRRPD